MRSSTSTEDDASRPAWAQTRSASCSEVDRHPSVGSRVARRDERCARSEAKRKKLAKRLKVVEAFREGQ